MTSRMIVGLLIMITLVVGVAVGEDACACGDILSTMMQRIERMDSTINIIARQDIETRVNGRFGQAFSEVDGKCSSDSPVSSLPIGSVQGIPSDVSGEAICSLYCRATDGCIAFNFLETPTSDGTQCQLFTGPSSECTDSNASCRYFVMNGEDRGCGSFKKTEVLMQQRVESTSSFFSRNWDEYKAGFGDETGNYWIGLERLHQLTSTGLYKLRVDVQAQSNDEWYREVFPVFKVGDETTGYRLTVDAVNCTGTAGEGWMVYANGMKFSTKDVDNDATSLHCAADSQIGNGGGGWYNNCSGLFVNGITGPNSYNTCGFSWVTIPGYRLLQSRLTLVLK